MGYSRRIAAIVCVLLFVCSAYLIQVKAKQPGAREIKNIKLARQVRNIPGWQMVRELPLDPVIVKELELDDYVYQEYQRNGQVVTLYVGYYGRKGKIGAAHDPLVCFPGQGWALSEQDQGRLQLASGGDIISYSIMTAGRGGNQERILYWFQAEDKAVATTLRQKLAAFAAFAQGKGEESAFVRITCTVSKNRQDCEGTLHDFTGSFYPIFRQYLGY